MHLFLSVTSQSALSWKQKRLKRGHVGECLKWWWSPEGLNVRFMGDKLIEEGLSKYSFSQMTGFYDAAGIAIRLRHSLKLFALLATPQTVPIAPFAQVVRLARHATNGKVRFGP
jgi:hypothetical protein